MNFLKRFTTWLLLLTVITASGVVSAKVASGLQNLSGGLHQENVTANALMHLAKIGFSYDAVSGSPVAPKNLPALKKISNPPMQQVNPRNLIPTQSRSEMSGSQIKRITKDIKENGFDQTEPVDVARNPLVLLCYEI